MLAVPTLLAAGGLPGMTNYVPTSGTTGAWTATANAGSTAAYYKAHEGLFIDDRRQSMAVMTDGTSNTVIFAEYLGAFANGAIGVRIRGMSWFGAGGFPSYWSAVADSDSGNFRFSYASRHSGILNVGMGDGSVRSIRKGNRLPASVAEILNRTNADWDTLQRLTGVMDGDVNNLN